MSGDNGGPDPAFAGDGAPGSDEKDSRLERPSVFLRSLSELARDTAEASFRREQKRQQAAALQKSIQTCFLPAGWVDRRERKGCLARGTGGVP
jgi:hypothetical protein